MKRVIVNHFGGPEVVSVVEEGDPQPGPGEVRVRVLASGVSLSDAQMRAGHQPGQPAPLGFDAFSVAIDRSPGPVCAAQNMPTTATISRQNLTTRATAISRATNCMPGA